MKFQLKHLKNQSRACTVVLVILIIFLLNTKESQEKYSLLFSSLISIIVASLMFIQNKISDTVDKINGVKPIWKFLESDSKIEYFSLDKSRSVVDNVRYYSLIVDEDHKIRSINMLNNKNMELRSFYFSSNALVKSETIYDVKDSFLLKKYNSSGFETLKTYEKNHKDEKKIEKYKKVIIIKATTIFDDETYFFKGDELSGGLILNEGFTLIRGKYLPYSGSWNQTNTKNKRILRAESYLRQVKNYSSKE